MKQDQYIKLSGMLEVLQESISTIYYSMKALQENINTIYDSVEEKNSRLYTLYDYVGEVRKLVSDIVPEKEENNDKNN